MAGNPESGAGRAGSTPALSESMRALNLSPESQPAPAFGLREPGECLRVAEPGQFGVDFPVAENLEELALLGGLGVAGIVELRGEVGEEPSQGGLSGVDDGEAVSRDSPRPRPQAAIAAQRRRYRDGPGSGLRPAGARAERQTEEVRGRDEVEPPMGEISELEDLGRIARPIGPAEHAGQPGREHGPSGGPVQLVVHHRLPLRVGLEFEGRPKRRAAPSKSPSWRRTPPSPACATAYRGARRVASR